MKETRLLMDMPITIEVIDKNVTSLDIDTIFEYFTNIDNTFSPFKKSSELSQINSGALDITHVSVDMKIVFALCEKTKKETEGYFDINQNRKYDPSGLVKGWAILHAGSMIKQKGFKNYYVDAGGDIQVCGKNSEGKKWKIGIRNPFNRRENIKIVYLTNQGIATSGSYIRGDHIYNPHDPSKIISTIVSLTVIGPDVYEADRFATACFAMGEKGIYFLEKQKDLEGYMIDKDGKATFTSGFEKYTIEND
jgi:FAD:protein FMN transferase